MAATSWASGAWETADVRTSNVIPAGWPDYGSAKDCIFKGQCPNLEDTAYKDVDISDAMQDWEDGATFHVTNGLVSVTTLWLVCSYNADGKALECWFDNERDWGLRGDLSKDARELRLFPVHSAPNEYELRLWVY